MLPRLLLTSMLSVTLAGCQTIFGPSEEHELDDAWDHWLSLRIVDYRYEVIRSCYCGGPAVGQRVVVVVHDDVVVNAWYAQTGEELPASALQHLPTVDDLFLIVDDALRTGADELDVRYDPSFGFPRLIEVDYQRHAVDDELTVRADDLRPI
ncbi:MAG TPA: DUF6174 domain-containing protein [Gemmatimonadales bacterium]